MSEFNADYYKAGQTILIDKPKEWTSFNVVNKVRGHLKWKYQIKKLKVGHAGTLDPLATGLLIVCIGRHTKKISEYSGLRKEYIAEITFGYTTPSYDLETERDKTFEFKHITQTDLENNLKFFLGKQEQIPPIYSAKNINGKRAYLYAREGKKVEMRKTNIEIYELEILEFKLPIVKIRVNCSAGTYIRSLAYDIGKSMNSGATLTALKRNLIGNFSLNDALSIEEFEKNS